MRWALLFLPLLSLAPPGGAFPGADEEGAAARALLEELAAPMPPRAQPPPGISCRALRPNSLPGFAQLPAHPRALARAALALALSGASCAPHAQAEVLALSQELGPEAAASVLRGLARLRGAPAAPQALPLLLGLVEGGSVPRGAARRRREDDDAAAAGCERPGEQRAHEVVVWLPGVSAFYNLGTSIYYAFQGCEALASKRALEAAEDLGYAGLAAVVGAAGGPVALGVQLGLQPGLKASVRALIGYFTSDGETPTPPTTYSGPVLVV